MVVELCNRIVSLRCQLQYLTIFVFISFSKFTFLIGLEVIGFVSIFACGFCKR